MREVLFGVRVVPAHDLHSVVLSLPRIVDVLVVVRVPVRRLPGLRRILPTLVGVVHDGHAAPVQQLLLDGVLAFFGGICIGRLSPVLRQDVAVLQHHAVRDEAVRRAVGVRRGYGPVVVLGIGRAVGGALLYHVLEVVEKLVSCHVPGCRNGIHECVIGHALRRRRHRDLAFRLLVERLGMRIVVLRSRHPLLAAIGEQALQHGAHALRIQGGDVDGQAARIVGGVRAGVYRVQALAGLRGVVGFRDRLQREVREMLLGKVELGVLVRAPVGRKYRGFRSCRAAERPAAPPGVLELHGRDQPFVSQVVLVGDCRLYGETDLLCVPAVVNRPFGHLG